MRKIVAGLFMSLDGVADAPDGWQYPYLDAEVMAMIAEATARADAMLLGRRTYDLFAALWPGRDNGDPGAAFFNGVHKYVVTSTTRGLDWGPVTRLSGDLTAELSALKAEPGKDVLIQGSTLLVRSLLRNGLLDELSLLIMPIVVGTGLRLFEGSTRLGLTLTGSAVFGNGVISVTYRPAAAV